MNRRHFLAALATTAAVFTSAAAGAAEVQPALKVLSYNIHHGEGVDGKLDLARIADVIKASGADVVALQEVDQKAARTGGVDQAEEIGRLSGLKAVYGKAMDFQGGAYGQALLSRWPLEDVKVHMLPNPAKVEPRIAVSATVRPPGRAAFRFIGTHLDATRDDTARWQQAEKLLELFGKDNVPTVFVGDFNARPDTRTMKALLGVFTDAAAGNPEFTIPSKKPTGRIDYVLLRPAGAWKVVSTTVIPEAVASDHRPLLAEISATSSK